MQNSSLEEARKKKKQEVFLISNKKPESLAKTFFQNVRNCRKRKKDEQKAKNDALCQKKLENSRLMSQIENQQKELDNLRMNLIRLWQENQLSDSDWTKFQAIEKEYYEVIKNLNE